MAIGYRVGNRLLTWLTNRCYGSSLTDMETCYKLIDRALLAARSRPPVSKSFDFEPENYRQDPEAGASPFTRCRLRYHGRSFDEGKKISWKDFFQAAWTLLKYRF